MNDFSKVPEAYRGLWRRLSLEDASGIDTTTQVVWLQGRALYCDLRLPAARPDFSGIDSLARCSEAQLRWLAGQSGFAGALQVDSDIFHWHRDLDFQPDARKQDVGRMVADGEQWLEYGVHASYVERWTREGAGQERLAMTLQEERREGQLVPRRGLLLVVDDWFIYCLGRVPDAAQSTSLLTLAEAAPDPLAALRQLLDFEISFGAIGGANAWQVAMSTLPFREGQPLFAPGEVPQPIDTGWARQSLDGRERLWRVHNGRFQSLPGVA